MNHVQHKQTLVNMTPAYIPMRQPSGNTKQPECSSEAQRQLHALLHLKRYATIQNVRVLGRFK